MTFKELRKRKFSKKKLKHNKCRKDEYFDKKTKTCKTKTKGKSKRKTKVKKVSISLRESYSRLSNSNNKNNSIKHIPFIERDTRIFLIIGHSNLSTMREFMEIRDQMEKPDFRLKLKTENIIKNIENLKVMTFQSIGLNRKDFVDQFVDFLQNEQFYSAFLQLDSIEKANILNIFFKKLYKQKIPNSEEILKSYDSNLTNFKVYPKPEDVLYPQNPINTTFSFLPTVYNESGLFGVFELTIPTFINNNLGVLENDYSINPTYTNKYIRNVLNSQKLRSGKKININSLKSFIGITDKLSKSNIDTAYNYFEFTKLNQENISQFYELISINEKLLELIEERYNDPNGNQDLVESSKFKLDEIIKLIITEKGIRNDEKIIIIDSSCKIISGLKYDPTKSSIIPREGRWESSVKIDGLGFKSVTTKEVLPYKYRSLFRKANSFI